MFKTLNFKALGVALAATLVLIASIVIGSRNLQNFDGALVAYLFGAVFACFGIVYRCCVWLQRPPTWRYWCRGWQLFFSGRMIPYGLALVKYFFTDIIAQRFIYKRGKKRWLGHFLMGWGCMLAFAVTIPLTFGWINFGLKNGTIDLYEAYLFGFKTMEFHLHSFTAFNMFHILNWSSVMVITGVVIILRRRLTDAGQIAIQTFEGDWLPLLLLLSIAVTGLGLTWDYEFLNGKAHQFMAITHAVTVMLFMLWMPFGKFFHIFQRPAQLGVAIYIAEGKTGEQAVCPHTKQEFASKLHINDLKDVTKELGFDFTLADGASHLDLSPQGKRAALARAHMAARQKDGSFFG